jgi:hypothetical protein
MTKAERQAVGLVISYIQKNEGKDPSIGPHYICPYCLGVFKLEGTREGNAKKILPECPLCHNKNLLLGKGIMAFATRSRSLANAGECAV